MTPGTPRTVSREQWLAARDELLVREKAHTRQADELARERRALPWLRVDKPYTLQTPGGSRTLSELFDDCSQLVIYHFMMGPDYAAGCPVCSSIADSFDGVLPHLRARDVKMMCVSEAPLDALMAFRERMGWSFDWASSAQSDFNADFEHSLSREQASAWVPDAPPLVLRNAAECGTDAAGYMRQRPGLSVFARSDDDVYLTYATTARGLEVVMTYYGILDRVPTGRGGGPEDLAGDPGWIRRRDEFETAA